MNHQNPVPLHLQQPLFIDTDINYSLDMSKFPGLDDPQHMYEPALLIAKQPQHAVHHYGRMTTGTITSPVQPNEPTKDVLEELLNILDPSIELLDRLSAPQDHRAGGAMYKSIMDACGFASNPPTITRRVDLSSQFYHQPQSLSRTRNSVTSDRLSMMDYYNGVPHQQQTVDLPKADHVRTQSTGYHFLNTDTSSRSTITSSNKRKRADDVDVSLCKRQCNRTDVFNCVGQSVGHVYPYPGFKETFGANRSFGLSY